MLKNIKIKLPRKEKSIEKFFCSCEKRKKFVRDAEGYYEKRLKMSEFSIQSVTGSVNSFATAGKILSMLKNHMNQVSYATSMPPICDRWFLTNQSMTSKQLSQNLNKRIGTGLL